MQRVLFVQYTNPAAYPPLEHISRILAERSWAVLFLGTRSLSTDSLHFPPHEFVEVRQMAFCPAGWRQKLHYLQFALWVLFWTLRWRPNWVYASDPLSCPVALLLSFLPGIRIAYHEHDSPSLRSNRFFRFCLAARKRLASRAQVCILPNASRAKAFAAEIQRASNILCVWNCPRREEVTAPRESKQKGPAVVYFHGNLSPETLPAAIVPAMAKFHGNVHLIIAGYETVGQEGYRSTLRDEAIRHGVEKNIEFLNATPRYELWPILRQCDIGLGLMAMKGQNLNMTHLVGASNKLFDYMAAGLSLLLTDRADLRETFVKQGYALGCDPGDPESIAAALQWFLEHREEMRSMGELGRQRIFTEWNYETQFSPVLGHLDRVSTKLVAK